MGSPTTTDSGATRGLRQRENLPAGGPLANNQKNSWEMIVNPDVDVCTKIENHSKTFLITQKNQPLIDNQSILSTEISAKRWPGFYV